MKSLNRKIDSFCFRHPRFGIPRLMMFIVIGNLLVYLIGLMDRTGMLYALLDLDPALISRGQIWRLVTFVLVPSQVGLSGVLWFAVSLYFYYFIGTSIEREWGSGKFTIYYISGMVITALYSLVVYWVSGLRLIVSASYLNLSLFFAFATLWPEQRVLLFFFIPVKMKWLAWADAALFAYSVVRSLIVGEIAEAFVPVVAMLTYVIFCGEWLVDMLRPSNIRQKTQRRARTVQFKTAVREAERRQRSRENIRRCAVCGRSELDSPGLEFRYCSRCAGYHCFCIDHINNHVHFTE